MIKCGFGNELCLKVPVLSDRKANLFKIRLYQCPIMLKFIVYISRYTRNADIVMSAILKDFKRENVSKVTSKT